MRLRAKERLVAGAMANAACMSRRPPPTRRS